MECSCTVRHSHPLCKELRFKLFAWWIENHHDDLDLTAITLGVSRRSLNRWIRRRDVPMPVAVLLEQIRNGRIVRGGRYGMPRPPWRGVVPEVRQLALELGPTGCRRCYGHGCSVCWTPEMGLQLVREIRRRQRALWHANRAQKRLPRND